MPSRKNFSDLLFDIKNGKSLKKNERYIVSTNDTILYNLLVKASTTANKLYNATNTYIRELFFKGEHIPTYKNNPEKTNFTNSLLNYMESEHLQYKPYLKERWDNTPTSIRKGIIYDVADKWFNREPEKIICNRKGKNRRCSFTIKNVTTIENKKFKNIKERKSINRYRYLLKFPKNIVGNNDVYIPTNIHDSLIIEVRITPNRGRFNIDICYAQYIPQKYERGKYPKKEENIAGIDLGIENLMAVANNVYQQPLLIRGKRLSAINAYYNNLIIDLKREDREKALKGGFNKKYARKKTLSKKIKIKIERLEKNRINKIHDYINKAINITMEYLEKWFIGTLVVGINKNTNKGFQKENYILPIDYEFLRKRLNIECTKRNIKYVEVDESYTSSTSILDNQLPIAENKESYRRFTDRLYMTQNFGIINCDINSAIQIICKYNPNAFDKVFKDIGVYDLIKGTDKNHPRIFKFVNLSSWDIFYDKNHVLGKASQCEDAPYQILETYNITYEQLNDSFPVPLVEKYRYAHISSMDDNYYLLPESELTYEQFQDSYEIPGEYFNVVKYNFKHNIHPVCIIDKTIKECEIQNHYDFLDDFCNQFKKFPEYKKRSVFDLRKYILEKIYNENDNKYYEEYITYKREYNNLKNVGYPRTFLDDIEKKYFEERYKIIENIYNKLILIPIIKYVSEEYTIKNKIFDEEGYKRSVIAKNLGIIFKQDNDGNYTFKIFLYNFNYPLMTEKKYIEKYINNAHLSSRKNYCSNMIGAYYNRSLKSIKSFFSIMPIRPPKGQKILTDRGKSRLQTLQNIIDSKIPLDSEELKEYKELTREDPPADPNFVYKHKMLQKTVSIEPLLKSKQKTMGKMTTPIIIKVA